MPLQPSNDLQNKSDNAAGAPTTPQKTASVTVAQRMPHSQGTSAVSEYDSFFRVDLQNEVEIPFSDFVIAFLRGNDVPLSDSYLNVDDAQFHQYLTEYKTAVHATTSEKAYYKPLVNLVNCVLGNVGHYTAHHTDKKSGPDSTTKRMPDISIMKKIHGTKDTSWARKASFVEVKPRRSNIAVKQNMENSSTFSQSFENSQSFSAATNLGKRPSDQNPNSQSSASKRREGPEQTMLKYRIQCTSYATEMLSNGGLRHHAIGFLVMGTEFQMLYYDRSIPIISTVVNFGDQPDKLVQVLRLIAYLTDEDWGYENLIKPSNGNDSPDPFDGAFITVDGQSLRFGKLIFRQHALIGRGTLVLDANVDGTPPDRWPRELVVKISFISSTRESEVSIVEKALESATGDHEWVKDHLPRIVASSSLPLRKELHANLTELVTKYGKGRSYEIRLCRVIVQEKLYSITEYLEPVQFCKCLHDIFNCYRWLVEYPGILHRDISIWNLMVRKSSCPKCQNPLIFGVLNDFDLALLRSNAASGPSSHQHTGTKPFMAVDLLERSDQRHLYRHDLESLFYIVLFMAAGWENGKTTCEALKKWFTADKRNLFFMKQALLSRWATQKPSAIPSFAEVYEEWVTHMAHIFSPFNCKPPSSDPVTECHLEDVPSRMRWCCNTVQDTEAFAQFKKALDGIPADTHLCKVLGCAL